MLFAPHKLVSDQQLLHFLCRSQIGMLTNTPPHTHGKHLLLLTTLGGVYTVRWIDTWQSQHEAISCTDCAMDSIQTAESEMTLHFLILPLCPQSGSLSFLISHFFPVSPRIFARGLMFGMTACQGSDLFPKQRCERLGAHFVRNCFNEAVEINLRESSSWHCTLGEPRCGDRSGPSSAVYLCTRSVSRQARSEGKMRKDSARVSQRFGASEDLWEYETRLWNIASCKSSGYLVRILLEDVLWAELRR